jgi:zinc protease
VYHVDSSFQAGRTRTVFTVSYACDPPNVSKARLLAERDIRAMQAAEVTEDEVRRAKILLLNRIPLSEASTDGIADGWIYRSVEGLPLDEPLQAARRYREMTAVDVWEAFVHWIRPDSFAMVTLGPRPE